jgi:phosphoserine phosphatase RsbU/P
LTAVATNQYSVNGMASPPRTLSFGAYWTSLPRRLLIAIGILFCAMTTFYGVVWMYDARSLETQVELGFNKYHNSQFDELTHAIDVADVVPGSPAEKAGLHEGDHIIGVNGQPMLTPGPWEEVYALSKPGDKVTFTVARPGVAEPIILHGQFRGRASMRVTEGLAKSSAQQLVDSFPVLFILVGFTVLFLRPDDASAWLLAFMFASFSTAPSLDNPLVLPIPVRMVALAYRAVFSSFLASSFYYFFAVFPVRSPLEKRVPWLKWAGLALSFLLLWPGLRTGSPGFPAFVPQLIGARLSFQIAIGLRYALIALGILSLTLNAFAASTPPDAKRKSRVILFGTVVGVLPIVSVRVAVDMWDYQPSFWLNAVTVIVVALYPLSFAYAVVRHRVMEIPALIRRSARYVLVQRSYFLLLFLGAIAAIFLFTRFFAGYFAQNSQFGMTLSAVFGVALVWVSGPFVRRGTDRIDRAFFRSSYDARVILQELAEKTRTVTDRHELANLLELQIEGALHPQSLACYLEDGDGNLTTAARIISRGPDVPPSGPPRPKFPMRSGTRFVLEDTASIPARLPLIQELARNAKAWDVPLIVEMTEKDDALVPDCLVPIVGRNSGLMGLLVLGRRLSEEPYSSEDKRLLDAVADQAAVTLENIRMAEQIAGRLESDRRTAREMDIARDVQSRLFPQVFPRLDTLEYAGSCIQAKQVGGDYYDFWDLGAKHLALVLADISGKGIAGALLMANLQANLRSRSAVARQDLMNTNHDGKWLPELLKSVNQLFYEVTPDDRYATVFLAVYDDTSRQLEYVNCGHNPPLLFRANGEVERLAATASVIGLVPEWECTTESVSIGPDDVLVIYTDGVTEANDGEQNEFGEERLRVVVRENMAASPKDLLTAIQQAVQKFSVGDQFDDLTLVVARSR